ncbi:MULTISPECIES: MBL fold metallo-hydrolase [unclassified Roseitalea]|uniref:MBL fold metallo-hydrolase n=1 Tax=unclassified Roseitalea TaxID=2639107 RepID=UPI00273DDB00|nr:MULTISPECIES: MBL fold metallo-hydrolase [unclassified Roseitalea]
MSVAARDRSTRLAEHALDRPLAAVLAQSPGDACRLFWLGQAGFVIEAKGRRIVIDPYLSDSLAEKYRGRRFDHRRMMPTPVLPDAIGHIDAVLATHAHTDHMDPQTLGPMLAANPHAVLVAPASARAPALERAGIAASRLIGIDAGETAALLPGLRVTATRAAHETMERDADGRHLFLGYGMAFAGGPTIVHSGDTVPFDGQIEEVAALGADLALLPVNGRDAARRAGGIPGNMRVDEAIALCTHAGIPAMIAHHFGMFAFNTVPRGEIEAAARKADAVHAVPARVAMVYRLGRSAPGRTGAGR